LGTTDVIIKLLFLVYEEWYTLLRSHSS